jgi:hypothetical protein
VQRFGHALLHFFQPPFHRLQHRGLRARLHVRHVAEAPREALLPLAETLHRLPQRADVMGQRFHRAGGAVGGAEGGDRQDQEDKQYDCGNGPGEDQGVGEVEDDVADLDHVRPKSRSISLSLSST